MGARTSLLSPPVLVVERRHRASPASRPLAQSGGGGGGPARSLVTSRLRLSFQLLRRAWRVWECADPSERHLPPRWADANKDRRIPCHSGSLGKPPAPASIRLPPRLFSSFGKENEQHNRRTAFRCNQSCCCRTHILLAALSLDCGSADRRRPTCHMYQRQSQWPSQLQSARTKLAVFASAWA